MLINLVPYSLLYIQVPENTSTTTHNIATEEIWQERCCYWAFIMRITRNEIINYLPFTSPVAPELFNRFTVGITEPTALCFWQGEKADKRPTELHLRSLPWRVVDGFLNNRKAEKNRNWFHLVEQLNSDLFGSCAWYFIDYFVYFIYSPYFRGLVMVHKYYIAC